MNIREKRSAVSIGFKYAKRKYVEDICLEVDEVH
jgi:hypothetical protein